MDIIITTVIDIRIKVILELQMHGIIIVINIDVIYICGRYCELS